MAKYRATEDLYEIRGPGDAREESHIPFLGKSLAVLKDMAKCGYILYKNGKRVKLSELTENQVREAAICRD